MWCRYLKGVPFSNIKGIQKGYLFYQNGIEKGKRLDLRAEPPRTKLFRVPLRVLRLLIPC